MKKEISHRNIFNTQNEMQSRGIVGIAITPKEQSPTETKIFCLAEIGCYLDNRSAGDFVLCTKNGSKRWERSTYDSSKYDIREIYKYSGPLNFSLYSAVQVAERIANSEFHKFDKNIQDPILRKAISSFDVEVDDLANYAALIVQQDEERIRKFKKSI
jgi:hypothetical protein